MPEAILQGRGFANEMYHKRISATVWSQLDRQIST
jgi:hypothetical protein